MTIKIEEGKYYNTKDGLVVGPANYQHSETTKYNWNIPLEGGEYWFDSGGQSNLENVDWDILSEVDQ